MSALRKMDFKTLDRAFDADLERHVKSTAQSLLVLKPYFDEMKERLSAQGRRTDLPDTPKGLTWTAWLQSKGEKFNLSLRAMQSLLSTGSTTRPTKALPEPHGFKPQSSELASDLETKVPEVIKQLNKVCRPAAAIEELLANRDLLPEHTSTKLYKALDRHVDRLQKYIDKLSEPDTDPVTAESGQDPEPVTATCGSLKFTVPPGTSEWQEGYKSGYEDGYRAQSMAYLFGRKQ